MRRFHVHVHVADLDHLGLETDDPAELGTLKSRAEAAGAALLDEGSTTCCYARSEKHWVTDPTGIAWEHFHTLQNIPVFREAAADATACCPADAPRGKPVAVAVAVKPASACC